MMLARPQQIHDIYLVMDSVIKASHGRQKSDDFLIFFFQSSYKPIINSDLLLWLDKSITGK